MTTTALAVQAPQQAGIVLSTIDELKQFALTVQKSGFAPKGFQQPEQIMIALEMGAELGMKPMAALQNIGVINNKPGLYGAGVPAIIRSRGVEQYIREWTEGEGEELVAYCETVRKGEKGVDNQPIVHRGEFSYRQAKAAGLLNKDTYKAYPKRMIQMRARYVLDDVYADVLLGMPTIEVSDDWHEVIPDGAPKAPESKEALTPKSRKRSASQQAKDAEETVEIVVMDVDMSVAANGANRYSVQSNAGLFYTFSQTAAQILMDNRGTGAIVRVQFTQDEYGRKISVAEGTVPVEASAQTQEAEYEAAPPPPGSEAKPEEAPEAEKESPLAIAKIEKLLSALAKVGVTQAKLEAFLQRPAREIGQTTYDDLAERGKKLKADPSQLEQLFGELPF